VAMAVLMVVTALSASVALIRLSIDVVAAGNGWPHRNDPELIFGLNTHKIRA